MTHCPHCGLALPAIVDAFCPECREPLDEPGPQPAASRGPTLDVRKPALPGILLIVLGVFFLVTTAALALMGYCAVWPFLGAVACFAVGLARLKRPRHRPGPPE